MSEYIDREAAKAILKQHEHRFTCADEADGFGSVKWSEYVVYTDEAQNCIDELPAADVAPVTKSRIVINNGRNVCFACCGEVSRDFKYCPWCGASFEVVSK